MTQQVINLGTNPNDGTGEDLRGGGQIINDNFTELYGLQSDIVNAGAVAFNFVGATKEQRIASADAHALLLGKTLLRIPDSFVPYDITLCPANASVRRFLDGGDSSLYNVLAYGAGGDGVRDDTTAIQAAITAASVNPPAALQGGQVYFPGGKYLITSSLVVPVAVNQNQVVLNGAGMRVSYIFPSGAAANFSTGVIRFGAATPDASGTTTNQTLYCGMEDMSIKGSALTGGGNAVGVQFTEMQKGWMKNVVIESLPNSSIGLYLRGSTTVGVGSPAAPHVWRCGFWNVVVASTGRPLVLENADENDFYNCNFNLPTGLTSGTNIVGEFIQGRNNRFYGLQIGGDTNVVNRPNYFGLKFLTPTKGANFGHRIYGMVAEGFDIGVTVESSQVGAIFIDDYDSSINRVAWTNGSEDGAASGERGNNVEIRMRDAFNLSYLAGRLPSPEFVALTVNSATPSVVKSDFFYCANSSPTTITGLTNGRIGQPLTIRLDANTTIQHGTGANAVRCPGGLNITGTAHTMVRMIFFGTNWEVTSVSVNA